MKHALSLVFFVSATLATVFFLTGSAVHAEEVNWTCATGHCSKSFNIGSQHEKIIHTYCENGATGKEKVQCTPLQDATGVGCKPPSWAPSGGYWDCQCGGRVQAWVSISGCP